MLEFLSIVTIITVMTGVIAGDVKGERSRE